MNTPAITVLMSVHNGEPFLAEAVESILAQTWQDFEFIIVNDASTDRTADILAAFAAKDSRVRVVAHEHCAGLTVRLNQGLGLAQANLVARMDADDIALPERLALQKTFMDANPQVVAVGGGILFIDEHGNANGEHSVPVTEDAIRETLLLQGSPIAHPAAMFRKAPVQAAGGYREIFTYAQDYDLWLRLAENHGLANVPDLVLKYRRHGASTNVRHTLAQAVCMALARLSAQQRLWEKRDFLKGRSGIADLPLALCHVGDFDITTLCQILGSVGTAPLHGEAKELVQACWTNLLHRVPTHDRESRSLAVAYAHILKNLPDMELFLAQEWQTSPYKSLYADILQGRLLAFPLLPFDMLDKALQGKPVEDHLLARELVWHLRRGDSTPAWLATLIRDGLTLRRGTGDIDVNWLDSRYGCLSLLMRDGLNNWLCAVAPAADISQAGPTASLGLLCRLGAALYKSHGRDDAYATLTDLGLWLQEESKAPQARDAAFLRHLAQLDASDTFKEVRTRLAACIPDEQKGFSVIVYASQFNVWIAYLSNILAYVPEAELIICDLSDNFALHFCETEYANKHRITVIAGSRGMYAPKNEALTYCRYPVIAFAKNNFTYSLNALPLAAEHLREVDGVWGNPHYAPQEPQNVTHSLSFDSFPIDGEEYFPLLLRRSSLETLGFFLNESEKAGEKEYRSRMRARGLAVAYAEDVLVQHGTAPALPASPAKTPLQKNTSLACRVLGAVKRRFHLKCSSGDAAEPTPEACAAEPTPETCTAEPTPEACASAYMPALCDYCFSDVEEWLRSLPESNPVLLVSCGIDLAFRRAGTSGNLAYDVLTPDTLPTGGGDYLVMLYAQEAESFPRDFLAANCTVLVYDGQEDAVYAARAAAYDIADLCVGMTDGLRDRLALLHPVTCRADSLFQALAWGKKIYRAREHKLQYKTLAATVGPGKPRPRIMLVVDTFYVGGRENVILALMPYLRDNGCDAILGVTRDITAAGKAMLDQAGLEYISLTEARQQQCALLQQHNVDLVAAQHCRDGVLAAADAGIPCIQFIYGMFLQAEEAELNEWKHIDFATSAYICVSALSAMCVDRYFGVDINKIAIIPCASSIPDVHGCLREDDPELRAELSIPPHSPVFIYPARLQDAKGQRILLDAFASALQHDPRIRLVLLGPCFDLGYKERIVKLIADYGLESAVIVAGHRDDLPRFFNLARALVMPSFTEGWSLAIAEAAQVGLPVIATDVGGATEQLRDTDGILLPAFADDLWRMTPARFTYAIHHEHHHHRLREALRKAIQDMAARPVRSFSAPRAGSLLSIEETCARYRQVFLATLDKKPVSALRVGTFASQKQSRYANDNRPAVQV